MKKSEIFFGVLRLPIDFIAVALAFLLAYHVRPITDLIPGMQFQFAPDLLPKFDEYLHLMLYASGFLIFLFMVNRMYSLKLTQSFTIQVLRIMVVISAWLMVIIAYYFLILHQLFFSRIALAQIWIFTIIFVTAGRYLILLIQSYLLRFGIGQRRVLFVGVSPLADQFYDKLRNDRRYSVIGALADAHLSRKKGQLPIVDTLAHLDLIVKKYSAEEIIQAEPNLKDAEAGDLLNYCRSNQIQYSFIPDLLRLQSSNVEVMMIGQTPLISLKETPLDGWGRVFKRLFDIVMSLFLILLLFPVWILVGLFIVLDSPGPVIYKSLRKYRDTVFNVYKFRSMKANADEEKAKLIEQNERSGPLFKIKNDPRITRVGKFLRKTSIDELPQLFNVLIGNMSLVGPRPHLPEEVEQYERHHLRVFALKPGVTGLAQISGRSNLDFEEEVKLDVYYIENWSLWFDIKLILKTIGVVFVANGD